MTAGLDDRRPDHTRPTIAFIVLAVAAAAVMTAGMTAPGPETPLAGDRPPRVIPAVPAPTSPRPSPEPPAFPDFSMADVVTLAAAEARATPRPSREADARAGTNDAAPGGATRGDSTATSGSRPGSQSGPRSGGSDTPSGSGSGVPGSGTRSGSGGSGGGATGGGGTGGGGSGSTSDPGPGRSTTGKGKARGQQDATPGRGSSAKKLDRVTTRVTGRVDDGQDGHGRKSARATGRR